MNSSSPLVSTTSQIVSMSSRLTKKSLVSWPTRLVNTPFRLPPWLAPRTRSAPTSTVISGADRPSSDARSISSSSVFTRRSEEHTSELQSLMRISYAAFCLKQKNTTTTTDYDSFMKYAVCRCFLHYNTRQNTENVEIHVL